MDVKCPHCGTEYEVEKKAMYRYAKCEVCGNGFVVGTTAGSPSADTPVNNESPRSAGRDGKIGVRITGGVSSGGGRIPRRFAGPKSVGAAVEVPKRKSVKSKIVSIVCILIGAMIAAGAVVYGGYLCFGDGPRLDRGIAHYGNGAHAKAFKLLLPLAKKGYAKAQLIVGDCYANGQGVFMDMEEAVKWYRAAAVQELPEAQHRMFECCRDGAGTERNRENAAKWCRKAAEAGLEDAMLDMGMLYIEGAGVGRDEKSAFRWFRKGAGRGHPMCLYKFGACYKVGYGVEKNEDEGSKWQNKAVAAWRKMADEGNTGAMIKLAKLYMNGDVVELDKEEAVKWYRRAAEFDDEEAQFKLATCYHTGEGVEEDQEEAAKWILKAAEKGAKRLTQWMVGRFYQEGWGVEKNPSEAAKWFERSAKKGYSLAKYYLAMCYLNGEGVQKDEAKAEQLLEEAADAGEEDAKTELKRIRDARAAEERRIAREKAEKRDIIAQIIKIESEIAERKEQINSILEGKLGGAWEGFDAGKIAQTDASASIKTETPLKKISGQFSENDLLGELNEALQKFQAESERIKVRLAQIAKVKRIYDTMELESRKEKCAPCGGTGVVKCARCDGKGSVIVKETEPCPICAGEDAGVYGSTKKGYEKAEVECNNCRGTGELRERPKCRSCGGSGKIKIESPRDLFSKVRCDSCGGSGRSEGFSRSCPKCHGNGKVEIWCRCHRCGGYGTISSGSSETCSACNGKGSHKCERCGGRGFSYRSKQQSQVEDKSK